MSDGGSTQSEGVALIAAERERQMREEGWTSEHDDQHSDGALAYAATSYACPEDVYMLVKSTDHSIILADPWPGVWIKKKNDPNTDEGYVHNLVRAGALLAAELDRLLRLPASPSPEAPDV